MVSRIRKLPNDIALITHRYVHRYYVCKLNKHYRDVIYMGCIDVQVCNFGIFWYFLVTQSNHLQSR
jgi:hypothetical protein